MEDRANQIDGDDRLGTRPGVEQEMDTAPIFDDDFKGAGRLEGKVALITGGDSGIGRAVAVAFAKEGAKVAIGYLDEDADARDAQRYIENLGGEALLLPGDVGDPQVCRKSVEAVLKRFGRLDILVNNAAEQHPQDSVLDITPEQLERTFRTNIFGMFFMVQAALPHMKEGSAIINTGSVTAYEGHDTLIDYASTKGAITTFTRSLAKNLADKKIRVNHVAPGPVWTPLVSSTFGEQKIGKFGVDTPLERPAQPIELAEAFIFLAWERASGYITGETIHVNGGRFRTT
ncbi:MAG TPA: glucose 1-dehydrogenase [Candidatus Limnocylindria bacterium]|nr:glucose 1-dehydrogenase [Candidatus Limnocylindria bacterium]